MKALKGQDPHQAFAALSKLTNLVIGKGEGVTVTTQRVDCDHYDQLLAKDDEIARLGSDVQALQEELQTFGDALEVIRGCIATATDPANGGKVSEELIVA
jgi:hypothetical protein